MSRCSKLPAWREGVAARIHLTQTLPPTGNWISKKKDQLFAELQSL
jgi:hypothetical protein